eukprot:15469093-Alexandrium_andersonii.AAC.1
MRPCRKRPPPFWGAGLHSGIVVLIVQRSPRTPPPTPSIPPPLPYSHLGSILQGTFSSIHGSACMTRDVAA